MSMVVLFAKKEKIIIPVILVACFITTQQRIAIFTIDFPMLRIILILGILRIIIQKEITSMTFNVIDKLMIYYLITTIITHTLLWGDVSSFVYICGQSVDIGGAYFFIRMIINDFEDYDTIIKTLVFMSIPISLFMLYEHYTGGRNLFSVFGGVAEWDTIRQGKLRAQGAFSHPIMTGTFGASLLPLMYVLWVRNYKFLALLGVICSIIITLASSSSGPMMTFAFGLLGIFFWILRKYTRIVRKLFFIMLICMHIAMKAPIWHLISRIDLVGGSTGYHRYLLIDAAVNYFWRWFSVGIQSTDIWGPGLGDVTNQYILEGARGGIIPLVFFIIIIVKCFQTIGISRAMLTGSIELQKYVWCLGVILFAYAFSFLSVSFFGQMVFFYYLLIAMISSFNNLPSIVNDNEITSKI
jgi:hypothetical protein